MGMSRFWCCAAVTLLGLVACIKRSERITVLADGSTLLQTAIEGDAADLRSGDALPEAAAGWNVEERSEIDQEGSEKLTRTAHRLLAPGQPWPGSYAAAGSDVEDLVLHFPTTLTIEQRPDGTYYHFRRVYLRRDYARSAFEAEQILESDEMRELQQKKPEELTPEERGKIADAVLQAHVRKIGGQLDATIEPFHGRIPQDALLLMRRSALAVLESPELVQRVHRMIVDQEQDEDFEGLEQQLGQQIRDSMGASLRDAGVAQGLIDAVLETADRVRRSCEITQDLDDEEWLVSLQMPGRIIAHDSFDPSMGGTLKNKTGVENINEKSMDLVISTEDGRTYPIHTEPFQVGWRFTGEALHDRDVVLMATSFVPNPE